MSFDGAGVLDGAAETGEPDLAADVGAAGGLDEAAVVHRQAVNVAVGHQLGLEGLDGSLVVDPGPADGGAAESDGEALVGGARLGHSDVATCAKSDGAVGGGERALIDDVLGDEENVAAVGGDLAQVDDLLERGALIFLVAPGEEGAVGEVQGGGGEALGVDLAALADEDAVGVDEDDGAVGIKSAVDGGEVAAGDAVEGGAGAIGLVDVGDLATGDAEAVPVDDGLGGGGVNVEGIPAGGDGGGTGDDGAAGGVGQEDRRGKAEEEDRRDTAHPMHPHLTQSKEIPGDHPRMLGRSRFLYSPLFSYKSPNPRPRGFQNLNI